MVTDKDIYANRIFLNAALPLVKVLAEDVPGIKSSFAGKQGIIQISAVAKAPSGSSPAVGSNSAVPEGAAEGEGDAGLTAGLVGTHFIVSGGAITVGLGPSGVKPDVELRFNSIPRLNAFFKGDMKALPKISGFFSPLFIPTMKTLLKLSAMLGAVRPPKTEADKELLVKLYFYLLANGVSQLNKAGEPSVRKWAMTSPDRVYAFRVMGRDELAAYIRVKAGKTKASRGRYTRALPFFCLAFRDVDAALGTLLQIDDLFEASCNGKIIMEGAPEFGSTLGDFMLLVAALAK
ncbi:MAG: hypothetical protein LBD78_02000 [Spirochaetaceae bacterium]|jgi:hypothetical protein|nr:hypothetical protein [Spirochaetaceae bacterium]